MEEADHLLAVIGADKIAPAAEFAVKFSGLLGSFSIVGISQALSHRRVVIHFPDAPYQLIVEFRNSYDHAALGRSPYVLASFLRKAFPTD